MIIKLKINKKEYKSYKLRVNKSLHNSLNNADEQGSYPKRYRSEFIYPGIMSYEDIGAGVVYVGDNALKKMNSSFIGKPVINEAHQDLTPEKAFKLSNTDLESLADGVVYEVGKLANGNYYCDMMIWGEATKDNIDNKGYVVSCAYIPTKVNNAGGVYEGVKYDEEVLDGTYTHNAIVNNPRYEKVKIYELPLVYENSTTAEACMILQNCKGEKMKFKFKTVREFLNGRAKENAEVPKEETPAEEEMLNMEGTVIDVDGEMIPLEEAVKIYKEAKQNEEAESAKTLSPGDTIEVDGETITVADIIAALKVSKDVETEDSAGDSPMENAEDNEETPKENSDDTTEPEIKNTEEAKPKENSKEKKNHYKVVENALAKTEEDFHVPVISKNDRLARGASKYGSSKGDK